MTSSIDPTAAAAVAAMHQRRRLHHNSQTTTGMLLSRPSRRDCITVVSLSLNVLFLFLSVFRSNTSSSSKLRFNTQSWNGGHPLQERSGSCWCGDRDGYCMCTPSLAIDLVVVTFQKKDVWLVRRKDTNQLANMGGFVQVGESAEEAVQREMKEEMSLDISLKEIKLLGLYSDPRRDNRRATASAVYVVEIPDTAQPRPADDVKEVKRISIDEIEQYEYFADHWTILMDYKRSIQKEEETMTISTKDFATDIARSTCSSTRQTSQ